MSHSRVLSHLPAPLPITANPASQPHQEAQLACPAAPTPAEDASEASSHVGPGVSLDRIRPSPTHRAIVILSPTSCARTEQRCGSYVRANYHSHHPSAKCRIAHPTLRRYHPSTVSETGRVFGGWACSSPAIQPAGQFNNPLISSPRPTPLSSLATRGVRGHPEVIPHPPLRPQWRRREELTPIATTERPSTSHIDTLPHPPRLSGVACSTSPVNI